MSNDEVRGQRLMALGFGSWIGMPSLRCRRGLGGETGRSGYYRRLWKPVGLLARCSYRRPLVRIRE